MAAHQLLLMHLGSSKAAAAAKRTRTRKGSRYLFPNLTSFCPCIHFGPWLWLSFSASSLLPAASLAASPSPSSSFLRVHTMPAVHPPASGKYCATPAPLDLAIQRTQTHALAGPLTRSRDLTHPPDGDGLR